MELCGLRNLKGLKVVLRNRYPDEYGNILVKLMRMRKQCVSGLSPSLKAWVRGYRLIYLRICCTQTTDVSGHLQNNKRKGGVISTLPVYARKRSPADTCVY